MTRLVVCPKSRSRAALALLGLAGAIYLGPYLLIWYGQRGQVQ